MSIVKNPKEFTVGTDIEFLMLNGNGQVIKPNNFFEKDEKLGYDDNGFNAELRTDPYLNPNEIITEIKNTLQGAVVDNPELVKYKWIGTPFVKGLPCGQHFHYGLSKKIVNPKDVCYILDNYLGSISILLEDREQGIARRSYNKTPSGNDCSYGKYGDFREKEYGGFEYRTPSSFLCNSHITRALLCLGKILVYEFINNKSFRWNEYIAPEDYTTMNQAKMYRVFENIWRDIESLSLYRNFKSELSIIPQLIRDKMGALIKNADMKETWGVLRVDKFIKPTRVSLESIWEDYKEVVSPEIQKNQNKLITEIQKKQKEAISHPNYVSFAESIKSIKAIRAGRKVIKRKKIEEDSEGLYSKKRIKTYSTSEYTKDSNPPDFPLFWSEEKPEY